MRQRTRRTVGSLVVAVVLALLPAESRAACCIEGCGAVPPWTSCTNTNMCTGGVCDTPLGSAIAFDENATCGEGAPPFSTCPPDEVGQCADGVNNDEWTGDTAVDCNDQDCFADPACTGPVGAPLASGTGLALLGTALLGVGIMARRARRRGGVSERVR